MWRRLGKKSAVRPDGGEQFGAGQSTVDNGNDPVCVCFSQDAN